MQVEISQWSPSRLCVSGSAEPDLVKSLARVPGARLEYWRYGGFTISFPARSESTIKRQLKYQ
jgi:hypothetical protein